MAGEQASMPNKMAGGGNRECLGLIHFDGFVLRCGFHHVKVPVETMPRREYISHCGDISWQPQKTYLYPILVIGFSLHKILYCPLFSLQCESSACLTEHELVHFYKAVDSSRCRWAEGGQGVFITRLPWKATVAKPFGRIQICQPRQFQEKITIVFKLKL